jgi:hypothetical protein
MHPASAQPTASQVRLEVLNRLLAQDYRAYDGVPEDGEYNNEKAVDAILRLLKTQPDICREYKNLSQFYNLGEDCIKNIPKAHDANNDVNRLIIDFIYNLFDGLLDKYELTDKNNNGKNILSLINLTNVEKYKYINRAFENSFYFGVYNVIHTNKFRQDEFLLVNFITSEQLLTGTPNKLEKINTRAVNILLGLDSLSAKTIDSIAKLLHEDRVVAESLGEEKQLKLLKRLRKPAQETAEHQSTRLSAIAKLTIAAARNYLLNNLVKEDQFASTITCLRSVAQEELQRPELRRFFEQNYIDERVNAEFAKQNNASVSSDCVEFSSFDFRKKFKERFNGFWPLNPGNMPNRTSLTQLAGDLPNGETKQQLRQLAAKTDLTSSVVRASRGKGFGER